MTKKGRHLKPKLKKIAKVVNVDVSDPKYALQSPSGDKRILVPKAPLKRPTRHEAP